MTANDTSTEWTTAPAAARRPPVGVVVAIGASAGALPALRTLLGGLDASTGATFVVVVHRAPGRDRRLVELLAPYLALPIREAAGDTLLEPDTIIVVPPTADVSVIDSHLRLVPSAD